jgi:hypothetical protein
MTDIEKYKDKETWHSIIARDIEASGETFDVLKIQAIYSDGTKNKRYLIVNYMTEEGVGNPWRTSFGNVRTKFEDLEAIFREETINQILER